MDAYQKELERKNKTDVILYESIKRVVKYQDENRMDNFQLNPHNRIYE